MASLISRPISLEQTSSPPHGWASLSSSPAFQFDPLPPEHSHRDSPDSDQVELHSQRLAENGDSSEATDHSNGLTPCSSLGGSGSTLPGVDGLSPGPHCSAYPAPPAWRADPLSALEGRSTPFNPVFVSTPPPTADRLPGRLGPGSLWMCEDDEDHPTPSPRPRNQQHDWQNFDLSRIGQHARQSHRENGDTFTRYPTLPTPPRSSARPADMEKLVRIVHILTERVQQLEASSTAHEAELALLRARLAQPQPRPAHTPQQSFSSSDGSLSPAQMRHFQSPMSMGPPPSAAPMSPPSARQAPCTLSTNSTGASRALTPLQQAQPGAFRPIKPVTPPLMPLTSGPSAGFTFGAEVPPSPTDSHSLGFGPSYSSSFSPHSPLAGRSSSLHDFSQSPMPGKLQNFPFVEHGLSIPSSYDPGDGYDFSVQGQINPAGSLFASGSMSATASALTTNPRRGRVRAQSEGGPRVAGASFARLAPIVAQAQWMAGQQQQPVFAPTGLYPPSFVHAPAEHINYRALVEGDLEIDAESFVRRILTHNDQQCSMYLQQRLKTSTLEHRKANIIGAVALMLLDLCLSKFGNFLVSRCLEQGGLHLALDWTAKLSGELLRCSLDPFGCHCVQKLLDCGDRTTKNAVVDEIIDHAETLTQKNSGHVWSKLLATANPPAFYERLSATGAGSWAAIAKEETGSLVVQSILESWEGAYASSIASDCERDIVGLATSQWGSFVLLHLVENGSASFRNQVVQPSARLSLDHFGAKAVEKAFKTGKISSEMVTAYVEAICKPVEGGRPAVIDIASQPSGSQLLTLLFTGTLTAVADKTKLIQAVRSYGVTLKQNKHGQKIYFLCERARSWAGH